MINRPLILNLYYMKTTIKSKWVKLTSFLFLMLLVIGVLPIFNSCSSDDEEETPEPVAYSNLSDDSTTSIFSSIPRIELSKVKSTQIKLYLSVTDQKGYALTKFNRLNLKVKQVCVGSTDTTVIGNFNVTNLNTSGESILTPLVLDYSGSMEGYTTEMEQAVSSFVTVKGTDDLAEIIKFSSFPVVVQSFTKDTDLLNNAIFNGESAEGSTAFYDAIGMGINDVTAFFNSSSKSYLGAVIGFTDGEDTGSVLYSLGELLNMSSENQIPIYAMGFGDGDTTLLKHLAGATGGRFFYAPNITDLQSIYLRISGQLKGVYQLNWNYTGLCSEVMIIVEASYKCKNGTFKSVSYKSFEPLRK